MAHTAPPRPGRVRHCTAPRLHPTSGARAHGRHQAPLVPGAAGGATCRVDAGRRVRGRVGDQPEPTARRLRELAVRGRVGVRARRGEAQRRVWAQQRRHAMGGGRRRSQSHQLAADCAAGLHAAV